jgi:glycine/D-amino acid oxidase-like deaminating enzyme
MDRQVNRAFNHPASSPHALSGICCLGFLILAALASAAPTSAPSLDGIVFAQVSIRQTVVIRVPSAPPLPPRIRWREKKTLKCVPVSELGGYAISQPDSIDLIVKGGARYRARLEQGCPSIAFYSGFYIRPPADGRICAGRDQFHSRAGGQCGIDKLRSLIAEK